LALSFGVDLAAGEGRIDPAWAPRITDPGAPLARGRPVAAPRRPEGRSARSFADAERRFEVETPLRETRPVDDRPPGRTGRDADVGLMFRPRPPYLGAFSFEQLAAAGRARELRPGGLARATALFATPIPPWCPEGF
jgi:hypothetical protein